MNAHLKFYCRIMPLALIAASLLLIAALPAAALEVIVDNDAPSCTVVGTWGTSTSSCYGADKRTHGEGTGTDTFTWNATLPAGWYRVDFRVNSNTTYSNAAKYTVQHRDGTEQITATQRRSSAGWTILGGAWYFDGTATVSLSDSFTSDTGTLIVADAIRFLSIFSFVHMSDSHIGYGLGNTCATKVANELKTLGKVTMATYGFDAPPPSFALHTGDTCEYGQEYWSTMRSIFSGIPFPIYYVLGNHDSTQNSNREKIRALHGGPFYAFDHLDRGTRYRFIALDSSITQSPRSSFTREELDWLSADLAALPAGTPAFLFYHHPIGGASDPKPYDTYRLLDVIRPYVVPIAFYGHGHSFNQSTIDGQRIVQGGATYNDTTQVGGYNIITVTHDRIHVAKKLQGEATAATGLISSLAIPSTSSNPAITINSPIPESIHQSASLSVSASISAPPADVTAADFDFDGDGNWRALSGSGAGPWTGSLSMTGMTHGRHWIRVRFTVTGLSNTVTKMSSFWTWDAYPAARWIVDLGATSLSAPAVANGKVYVGANGGAMRCLNARTGAEIWSVNLPSDIVSAPAVSGGRVVFGCGNSKVYCLDAQTGATLWAASCSGPVYSPPAIDSGTVYIGSNGTGASNSAYLYALNLATGAEKWKSAAACAIESRPCVLGDTVYYGAWDSYFYALNTATGARRWRYQRNTSRYYSPADSWPVVSASSNRVFVADRQYYLSAINITTGVADWTRTGVSSQAITPDGTGLLIRNSSSGALERITFDNATVWSQAACSLDVTPVSPVCAGERAAVVDQDGLVSVLNLANGSILWQFLVASGYQLCPVTLDDDGAVYAVTYDGFLVCAANSDPPPTDVLQWQLY